MLDEHRRYGDVVNRTYVVIAALAASAVASCSLFEEPASANRSGEGPRTAVALSAFLASEQAPAAPASSLHDKADEAPTAPTPPESPPAPSTAPSSATPASPKEAPDPPPPAEDIAIIKLAGRWFEGLAATVEQSGDNCAAVAKAIIQYGKTTKATVKKIKTWLASATTAQKKAAEAYVEDHVDPGLEDRATKAGDKISAARQRCRDNPDVEAAINEWTLK